MSNDTKERLLKVISNWSIDDVVVLLQRNNLSECCDAVVKRQVDGEEFLRLSETKLNLWKSDITRHLQWNLCQFVQNLTANPEQYCSEENRLASCSPNQSGVYSDSDGWGTDFDDKRSTGEDSSHNEEYDDPLQIYENIIARSQNTTSQSISENSKEKEVEVDDNINTNGPEVIRSLQSPVNAKTSNGCHTVAQQIKQLQQVGRKTELSFGPNQTAIGKNAGIIDSMKNKLSFLHSQQSLRLKINSEKVTSVRPETTGSIEPTNMQPPGWNVYSPGPRNLPIITPAPDDRLHKSRKPQDLPKPPLNLPNIKTSDFQPDHLTEKTANDEDDNESYYELVNGDPQKTGNQYRSSESLRSTTSTQSLASRRSKETNESPQYPPSVSNAEDNEDETYEVIPYKIDDQDMYLKPVWNRVISMNVSRLPTIGSLKKKPLNRSDTFPRNTRSTRDIVSRPLPRPPPPPPPPPPNDSEPNRPVEIIDVPSYTKKPWFHNVGRNEAIALIRGGSSRFPNGPPDGYFLLRPSSAHVNQPWTLVLWYKNKIYNIAVRKRLDSQYALGKIKPDEESFTSIEEMVNYYKQNELVLSNRNENAHGGKIRLTESPQK